jgi:hypothetical protein
MKMDYVIVPANFETGDVKSPPITAKVEIMVGTTVGPPQDREIDPYLLRAKVEIDGKLGYTNFKPRSCHDLHLLVENTEYGFLFNDINVYCKDGIPYVSFGGNNKYHYNYHYNYDANPTGYLLTYSYMVKFI